MVSGCATLVQRQVVVLPASALSSSSGRPAVWVVDAETLEVTLRPVSVASYQSHTVIIEGGLEPGERVVTAGAKVLRPNQVVAIAAENAS
jgi:multidrug efflux pump subunit AcrA (membrane-fusion protein)